MKNALKHQSGQSLIAVITLVTVGLLIITAALSLNIVNRRVIYFQNRAEQARQLAESGLENATLQLLRNHAYTGETFAVDGGQIVTTVTANNTSRSIRTTATVGDAVRTFEATGTFTDTVFTLSSWKEVDL